MANKQTETTEKFKTMIGGQALIEGILMRGPEKDAIVIRTQEGLTLEVAPRRLNPPGSWKNLPFLRGVFNFFDANVTGVKALLRSADLAPEEYQEEPSRFDRWLEEKLGNEGFQKAVLTIAVALGLGLSIGLFFLLPMILVGFFDRWIPTAQEAIEPSVDGTRAVQLGSGRAGDGAVNKPRAGHHEFIAFGEGEGCRVLERAYAAR